MKNMCLILWCLFSTLVSAQITVTGDEYLPMNSVIITANDTLLSGITVGNSGTNETWNFSGLNNHNEDTVRIVEPNTTPYYSLFPSSNNVMYRSLGKNYYYGMKNSTGYSFIGYLFYDNFFLQDNFVFQGDPVQQQLTFPSTYNIQFNDSAVAKFEAEYGKNVFGVQIDSIRNVRTIITNSTIDGWGTTITPTGSYNTIRQKSIQRIHDKIEGLINFGFFSVWTNYIDSEYVHVNYNYIGDQPYNIVSITVDSSAGNAMISANYFLSRDTLSNTQPIAINDYVVINMDSTVLIKVQGNDNDNEGGTLTTTILTSSVHGTSTLQNENILYQPNSGFAGRDTIEYQICDNGNPTLCDTAYVYIYITSPPIAVNDLVSTPKNTFINIDVQANDINDGGIQLTTFVLVAPSNGATLVLNNDSIKYTPSNNYVGNDSFTYRICDNSVNPPQCSIADVQITVTPGTGIEIINAVNDFSVYPNPANSILYIKSVSKEKLTFLIFDVTGIQVAEKLLSANNSMNISNLQNGIYFYHLLNDAKEIVRRGKFAVVR